MEQIILITVIIASSTYLFRKIKKSTKQGTCSGCSSCVCCPGGCSFELKNKVK
ncbi:radical SAM additional 4Fe4S-binding SPASM domain-containing protein [Desulfonispora thiosulfatigenes DSM 11270]|uniref:Radical SAM additional 4Fe4S-binding SPASM domain-containing protein n=1 Tax=Desulfonispora thiosulfatigenes DSM 11270 TaxID=656914 RepID=A0A1W1VTB5_DESTI|nr:FeoB-associated Cys-rich membrane protein [Desulfonispora thiosulfatigenes]SMB96566.1 radical SAM additional 4Fe4S-binding SPASM domain-containing protein [Desulfonispora thiosulfatigenes DSM 11270]